MNIIFGEDINQLPDSYTILELDSFRFSDSNEPVASFCVVEKIPLSEFATLDAYRTAHQDLIKNYRAREWEYCQGAIKILMGRWNGEVDTFYQNLLERVENYIASPPDDTWDGIIQKGLTTLRK
jgi:hypothetical protein